MSDRVLDIQDLIKAKTSAKQTTHVLLDPGLEEERTAIIKELARAKSADDASNSFKVTAPAVQERLDKLEAKIAETRVPFVFQSIGRRAYDALLDENKPRPDHEDDKDLGFNEEEFPPRLIALSSYEPEINLEQARTIWDDWSSAETTLLFGAAVLANKEVVDVPFTNDGLPMGTLNIGTPSSTAMTEESPTPSS